MSFATPKARIETVESRPGCIQSALCILGDKWSPLLVAELTNNALTFSELQEKLCGISPRTLSARLDKLYLEKIIQKVQYNKHPARYKYKLTKKGSELLKILQQMASWGEKHKVAS